MLPNFFSFRILITLITAVLILLVITARIANSSEEIDMSQLSCGEFLEMDRMPQVMSIVWYNGFAAQERGTFVFTPDRDHLSAQKDSLTTACEANSNDLVVRQLPAIFSY
jgi:HdeA/HdeB family